MLLLRLMHHYVTQNQKIGAILGQAFDASLSLGRHSILVVMRTWEKSRNKKDPLSPKTLEMSAHEVGWTHPDLPPMHSAHTSQCPKCLCLSSWTIHHDPASGTTKTVCHGTNWLEELCDSVVVTNYMPFTHDIPGQLHLRGEWGRWALNDLVQGLKSLLM